MQIGIINNNLVVSVGHYRDLFPYTVFPDSGPSDEWLAENSCMKVNLFKPHDSATEFLEPCEPYIKNGWIYAVKVSQKTPINIQLDIDSAASKVRAERNFILRETDWTQGKDIPDSISEPWAVYRQSLRDIPEQEDFPMTVIWPTAPQNTNE